MGQAGGLTHVPSEHCARCGYLREYHEASGRCPGLKTGGWQDRAPLDTTGWREIMRRDYERRRDAYAEAAKPYQLDVTPLPRVAARAPRGPEEFADKRQAGTLGRLALSLGWRIEPWYAEAHDGAQMCAIKLERAPLSAVAIWRRPRAGGSWASDVAYAWRTDVSGYPINVGVARLTEIIKEAGAIGD